jgi:hypothetical protein
MSKFSDNLKKYFEGRENISHVLKSSPSISHLSIELRTNVSGISLISRIVVIANRDADLSNVIPDNADMADNLRRIRHLYSSWKLQIVNISPSIKHKQNILPVELFWGPTSHLPNRYRDKAAGG